jgi:hypothetical protein
MNPEEYKIYCEEFHRKRIETTTQALNKIMDIRVKGGGTVALNKEESSLTEQAIRYYILNTR